MTRCSVQPRDRIFVKSYEFLSFAKNMGKNINKDISKNLSRKYCQNLLDHPKQPATDVLKTASRRANQKRPEATDDLIGNKIAKKITKRSPQNTSETVESETEIPKERYISPKERQLN